MATATTITNIAQLPVTAQVAVSTAIRVRHDVAAAVVDVTVRLCAKTSAFYRRIQPEVVTIYENSNWIKPVKGGSDRKKIAQAGKMIHQNRSQPVLKNQFQTAARRH